MENASKALLMAGSVLIAILVIGIAVRLFSSAYEVSKTYDSGMQSTESRTFNAHFTKFYGAPQESGITQQYATIHDVITTANFAYSQNKQSQGTDEYQNTSDPIHISIDLQGGGIPTPPKINNLENLAEERAEIYNELISNCYYKNSISPNVEAVVHFEIVIESQNNAGKINHVTFKADDASVDSKINTIKVTYSIWKKYIEKNNIL